jgi:pyrimidine-nucleoside phosphorylase
MAGRVESEEQGRRLAEDALVSGKSWDKFLTLVKAQGGNVDAVEKPETLQKATLIERVAAPRSGYLKTMNARIIGETSVYLGAGRAKKEDRIDHSVGVVIHHKVGDHLAQGDPLFTIHANDAQKIEEAHQRLLDAHAWSDEPVEPLPLFYGVIR